MNIAWNFVVEEKADLEFKLSPKRMIRIILRANAYLFIENIFFSGRIFHFSCGQNNTVLEVRKIFIIHLYHGAHHAILSFFPNRHLIPCISIGEKLKSLLLW